MGDELIKGVGFDRLQGANLRVAHHGPVDCATVRLPTYKHIYSPSHGDDEDDNVSAGFEATSTDWLKYLQEMKPSTCWMETDPSFKSAVTSSGRQAMDVFLDRVRKCGYTLVWFVVPHALWLAGLPKSSLIIAGFRKSAGGSAAAAWFRQSMQPMLKLQSATGPFQTLWNSARSTASLPGILDFRVVEPFDESIAGSVAASSDLCRVLWAWGEEVWFAMF